jgi:tetratricopeptide (TPR) repeat protein
MPRAMQTAHAAGDRAFSAGRYQEAAQHYRQAAQAAERQRDRDELLYMEAASLRRADMLQEASERFEQLQELSPAGQNAARAAFERADIEVARGDKARGYAMHEEALRRYPDSGLARRQLMRLVAWLDESQGTAGALQWLRANLPWLRDKEPGETAMYLLADKLEQSGEQAAARDAFVACARAFPYPKGALHDDALVRASHLDEKLGDPSLAVKHLRELLANREPSTMNGSYERPRYGEAQMRIATLYRDALKDHAQARKEFRKLFREHTTSLLRDDALWQEALLAKQDGDGDGACEAVTTLVRKLPQSRFAPCARELCETAPQPEPPRSCRAYIRRSVRGAEDAER